MSIDFRKTKFITSVAEIKQLPPDNYTEIVFAGSSNSGKSSTLR